MYQEADWQGLTRALGCFVVLAVLVLLAVGVTLGRCSTRYTVKIEAKPQAAGGAQ